MQPKGFAPDQHAAARLSLLRVRAEGRRPHIHFNCGRPLMMHPVLLSVLFAEKVLQSIRQLHRTAHRLAMLGQARASNDGIWIGRVTGNRGKTPCTGDARS